MLLLNNKPVEFFKFPDGALQVRLPPLTEERATITWKGINSDSIMMLFLTYDALKRMGVYSITIEVLYLPYMRQDKVHQPGEAVSSEVMASLLKTIGHDPQCYMIVHDPHSYQEYLDCYGIEVYPLDIFKRHEVIPKLVHPDLLFIPDHGAYERGHEIAQHYYLSEAQGRKERDGQTGAIREYEIDMVKDAKSILVVDDICDGGATFITLAQKLREQTEASLTLYVTHGIFSKGLDELCKYYDSIICYHSVFDNYKSAHQFTVIREFTHD